MAASLEVNLQQYLEDCISIHIHIAVNVMKIKSKLKISIVLSLLMLDFKSNVYQRKASNLFL